MSPRSSLYPCEVIVLCFLALALLLYAALGVPLRAPLELYLSKAISGLCWYGFGLLVSLLILRLLNIQAREDKQARISLLSTWGEFTGLFFHKRALIRDLRLVHAISLMFVVFIELKHLIPFVNNAIWDEQFGVVEKTLFSESLLSGYLIELFGTKAAPILSSAYTFFYPYMGLLVFLMILQRNQRLSQEFCLVFPLMWLVGILIVYIVPTYGPCFSSPEFFQSLPFTEVSRLQEGLWQQKLFVQANPLSTKGVFLISGFPSLHLAATVLGSVYLARVHWMLAALSWIFAAITLVSTIYFGWHFVLDDVGAVFFVLVLLRGIRVIMGLSRNSADSRISDRTDKTYWIRWASKERCLQV